MSHSAIRSRKADVKQYIRLKGISEEVKGKVWEHDSVLRAGRLGSLEIVLDDTSVSRRHAELKYHNPTGWSIRDLESTNGTFINSVRLGTGERPIKAKDIIQFGKVVLVVESTDNVGGATFDANLIDQIQVEASTSSSWEDAIEDLVFDKDRGVRPGEQLIALLRAGYHLVHIENENELLHSILNDAVQVLDAQRGAIVLAEGPEQKLKIRATATGLSDRDAGRFHYSQKLALRCFEQKESILCGSVNDDPDLATAQSIADGAMASVMCVHLRTPRRQLGVLHLDRSLMKDPFTKKDLHLADALAAHVSVAIECAQLLKYQRELFMKTIEVLAQAIELRDEYTGGHTARVKRFAMMLGRKLKLSDKDLERLEIGTLLHDIGKIGIHDAILRKPGQLSPEEFDEMKKHTTMGANFLHTIEELHPIIPIVRNHHERWDGTGYPDGLAGDSIPYLARIVAITDAFDAMTTARVYRKARPVEAALADIVKQSGTQFDPNCAAAFLSMRDEIEEAMTKENETALVPASMESPSEKTAPPPKIACGDV